ncbi:gamma-glutamylcyclotransferase family protein [Robiginitalea sp. IMCC43444]|uniref:gamma-glutamylcyclotransferase family protein n=1 Tax=Robiginitalea sp. IMCC43444 TaxID=3459121 RepID=UPI0040416D47
MKKEGQENLFAYGTLCDPHVQVYVFGRTLSGHTDTLAGYYLKDKAVLDRYPAIWKGQAGSEVSGMCYSLSAIELKKADAYETSLYFRRELELASGKKAWVYLPTNTL